MSTEEDVQSRSAYKSAPRDRHLDDLGVTDQPNHRFHAFRSRSGHTHQNKFHLRTSAKPSETYTSADSNASTILHSNQQPTFKNPYGTGRTPLKDKDLGQSNGFYLSGKYGTDSVDEFEHLYEVLNLPDEMYENVRYTFINVIEADDNELYVDDKQIKNLPKLRDLEPESFVDWYDEMENELMMISKISLMPFDAIVLNWRYVGLCIPGVGERRYLDMASVLWRICKRTLPHDEEAVKDALKINSGRAQDGFRLIWEILIRSQPAFCPWKRYYEPLWTDSRDLVTHSKRWILFFQFMSKSDVGYSSDTEHSLFFLQSIQEPALLSQSKSLEVCIINENAVAPTTKKGRAPLPTHLLIPALTETMKQTIQPITFSGASNRMEALPFLTGANPQGLSSHGNNYSFAHYGPLVSYSPSVNQHTMRGTQTSFYPTSSWTERCRGNTRQAGDEKTPKSQDNRKRGSRHKEKDTTPRVVCQACFVPGHEAAMCWTLARALLAADYIQKLVDKEVLKRVVDNYKQRFQLPESPRANKLCQETMWAYCIDNHTTPEHVCRQFNWMGLAEPSNDSGDDSSYDSSEGDRESNGEEV